ncbi:MAG: hypothetical protein E7650_08170, partial [Ruminococcaceae bacterium]|nr:hypothetical protein [Oscillospiraceae bacterium]
MDFLPYMEIYPNYEDGILDGYDGTQRIATNSFLKDGNILYLMGGTVLCKYDISDSEAPRLLNRADIAADHTGDPAMDYIRKGSAHSTAIVDIGDYLVLSLRGGGGGVSNMADGVIVGNISIVNKETLEKVKELNFENRVTYITKYKDFLIVSLHFHGFYIYKISNDDEILSCIYRYIVEEKPRTAGTIEFQNSVVFEADMGKIKIAFASYSYGITVFTYDLVHNLLSPCCDLHPKTFPDMFDAESGVKNTVFGITSKGNFVYGGITPGHSRFYVTYQDANPKRVEKLKNVDWDRFDKRGIIYGPHDRLAQKHYHMELPDIDKPECYGAHAGDPSPSFLCTAGDYLLFNLDKQGLGVAKIENDGKLAYIGRALEDPDG